MSADSVFEMLRGGGMSKGRALHVLQQQGTRRAGPAMRELAQAIVDREAAPVKAVRHPADGAIRDQYRRESDEELSAVELAWLQRLPLNPAEVSFDDAARLAALADTVSSMKAPASARLVQSVWGPVKSVHDKRVAEARLENARQPAPIAPSVTTKALAEAIEAEYPGLGEGGAMGEAIERLDSWSKQVRDKHDVDVARAEENLAEVERTMARASDTTGEVA